MRVHYVPSAQFSGGCPPRLSPRYETNGKISQNTSGYNTVISISGGTLSLRDPHLLGQNNSPASICAGVSRLHLGDSFHLSKGLKQILILNLWPTMLISKIDFLPKIIKHWFLLCLERVDPTAYFLRLHV
jgi:hypothetical protein